MFILAIFAGLLIVTLPLQIQNTSSYIHNLGFSNYTSDGVTQKQINSFIGFVNTAASLYDNDVQKHLVYIVNQMNTYLGSSSEQYSVIIQRVSDSYSSRIYGVNLAMRSGINPKRPTWSYLFYRYKIEYQAADQFIFDLSKGEIPESYSDTINSIISQIQGSGQCDCSRTATIGEKINSYIVYSDISVVCEESLNTISQVNVCHDYWIYTRPKHCYYTVWVHRYS